MDLRFLYWIMVGAMAFESPYRDLVAIIAAAIYIVGVIIEFDLPGISIGLNSIAIWFALFPRVEFSLTTYAIWVILISINYLVVKAYWNWRSKGKK